MNFEQKLMEIIKADKQLMYMLKAIQALTRNDCWIAAGVIRNKVWDTLYAKQTELNDIDVIYYERENCSVACEKLLEDQLQNILPGLPWSVKNQARMHVKNKLQRYESSFDGVAHFPETPTAIAVRLNGDHLEIMAPYGLDDLFNGVIRPTPPFQASATLYTVYQARIKTKNWSLIWEELVIKY